MRSKLYLRIMFVDKEHASLNVLEQTGRGRGFNPDGFFSRSFRDYDIEEHIMITSDDGPEWSNSDPYGGTLFVRGAKHQYDDAVIKIPIDKVDSALRLVLRYNQQYSKNKLVLSDVIEGLELLEDTNVKETTH